VKTWTG